MALQTHTQLQQSTVALSGTWKLPAGRAITLRPGQAGVLKIAHGSVWATFDGPHRGPLNDLGDRIVGVGQTLAMGAGQRLVIEAWNCEAPAYFSWDPAPAVAALPSPRVAGVLQPLSDLRLALALGAGATGRLGAGLVRLAFGLATGRGRATLADCAFNAQSRACRAHGAMS